MRSIIRRSWRAVLLATVALTLTAGAREAFAASNRSLQVCERCNNDDECFFCCTQVLGLSDGTCFETSGACFCS